MTHIEKASIVRLLVGRLDRIERAADQTGERDKIIALIAQAEEVVTIASALDIAPEVWSWMHYRVEWLRDTHATPSQEK